MLSQPLFLHALTPIHAGTGQGIGIIDLPIAREKASGLPYLPGSSIKGTLRDCSTAPEEIKNKLFGAMEGQGAAQFADARLLLLPVRSLCGTFAWTTSPYVLRRFARDLELCGQSPPAAVPQPTEGSAKVAQSGSSVVLSPRIGNQAQPQVVLEDLDIPAQPSPEAERWATWLGEKLFVTNEVEATAARTSLRARFCVLHEDIFNFLMQTATEVVARTALDDLTKTVKQGHLWYEEALPAESVLTSVIHADPLPSHQLQATAVIQAVTGVNVAQFGGKATVGRGLCRVRRA